MSKSRPRGERLDMAAPAATQEPSLAVRPRPAPFFLRRRFLRQFMPVASLAVVGLVALLVSANLLLPFERLVTLEGAGGSKAKFLDDQQVRELLLRHHIRVQVTRLGSRGAAADLDSLDFIFSSGQPAAELVTQQRREAGKYASAKRPFVSPIVLATYRDYAETLRAAGISSPQATPGFDQPYYYDLDVGRFLALVRAQRTWDDLDIRAQGFTNGNTVLAQTTNVCGSNSAATYLGLVSYLTRGGVPTTEQDAANLAAEIKPLLRSQGLPVGLAPADLYFVPEGRQIAPIIVLYEHQYLAHQLRHRDRFDELDGDRVLLYPSTGLQTEPTLVALNEAADRLGGLLSTDDGLRRRALELGFRVLDPNLESSSEQLPRFLAGQGVPEPSTAASDTRALLPDTPLLETMISVVGDCPPGVPE